MKKNFYLDLVIFIACLACLITGLMLDFHLFEGGREVRHYWRDIHGSLTLQNEKNTSQPL